MDRAIAAGDRLLVPTIVLAAALYIADKNPSSLDYTALLQTVRDGDAFDIVGFDVDVLEELLRVEGVPELHDRVIVATARVYGAGVLTRDRVIRSSGAVETA